MKNIDTLHIELTDKCNLSCNYCYQRYLGQSDLPNSNSFKKSEFDIIKNSSINSVNFTGGEPTLCGTELFTLAKVFSESGKNIVVTTNGLKRIASLEYINTIVVSLDGFFTEMNSNRNVNLQQYKLIIDNILYYLKNGINVQLNIVITRYNLHKFSNFIKTNQFGDSVSYSVIVVSDKTVDKNLVVSDTDDYRFIANEIFDIYKFFNYHIKLRSNLMPKSSFIDTFSNEFPITFFSTYSVPTNKYRYVTNEFNRFDALCKSYYITSQMITEEIIRRLCNLNSDDWFNPYSWAELIGKKTSDEV